MNQQPAEPDSPEVDLVAVSSALGVVRENALELLREFHSPPSSLRIQAAGVTVEAQWPQPEVGTAPTRNDPTRNGTVHSDQDQDGSATVRQTRHEVRAPAVGVFHVAPAPGAKPFVAVGDTVSPGDQVAIIEVMKLMIPVEADAAGTITEVLKANGEPAEYDEPLFALEPA